MQSKSGRSVAVLYVQNWDSLDSKGTALIEWRLREEFRKFFSSLFALASRWIAFCEWIGNWDALRKELQVGNLTRLLLSGEGDFTRSRKIMFPISCDFVSVDFLNSIRFSCGFWRGFHWLLKCTACMGSGCERFSKPTNWFLFGLRRR